MKMNQKFPKIVEGEERNGDRLSDLRSRQKNVAIIKRRFGSDLSFFNTFAVNMVKIWIICFYYLI